MPIPTSDTRLAVKELFNTFPAMPFTAVEIAARTGLNTTKAVQNLRQVGWLESRRVPGQGTVYFRSPNLTPLKGEQALITHSKAHDSGASMLHRPTYRPAEWYVRPGGEDHKQHPSRHGSRLTYADGRTEAAR